MNTIHNKTRKSLDKLGVLARTGEVVFHAKDLANLWRIENRNTLHVLLSRYVKQGHLYRIQKGMYSIRPPEGIDPLLIGLKALHSHAYVSTETVLSQHGILFQNIPYITLVSGVSKRFSLAGRNYSSRKLADKFLYNPTGITTDACGVRRASFERALADLFYFNPRAHMDAEQTKVIDWRKILEMQKNIGYPTVYSKKTPNQ